MYNSKPKFSDFVPGMAVIGYLGRNDLGLEGARATVPLEESGNAAPNVRNFHFEPKCGYEYAGRKIPEMGEFN
ncbi:hypothetical protein CEXT_45081 [Caerostris extrusa]|uniref:Uncharacterized protein n=1 Tax=Caerostris extrusa TaxID=172846 RepID=A0AAV4URH5_CAEEX|nr:hypothetical protein CEXT_45081 [Caerostris extrusa]